MDGAKEGIKVPQAISTVVWTEIEDEVMGELHSDRNVSLKDRVKAPIKAIY